MEILKLTAKRFEQERWGGRGTLAGPEGESFFAKLALYCIKEYNTIT